MVSEYREIKLENGETVKITEEELQKVVDLFKLLRKWDNELKRKPNKYSKTNFINKNQKCETRDV